MATALVDPVTLMPVRQPGERRPGIAKHNKFKQLIPAGERCSQSVERPIPTMPAI